MTDRAREAVFIEAPARLHFGMLDLRGTFGRRFGGIGAAVPEPSLLLEAAPARTLHASGPSGDRALEFARRFLAHHHLEAGASFHVHRAIPSHAGLGSGTQLALAVARALAELHGLPTDPAALARAVGRAQRSAIGTWLFGAGGFVLEGGRRPESSNPAPLLARYSLPERWRCVVVLPPGTPGVSGEAEASAFAHLPPPPERSVMRVSHIVVMALLPAIVEGDLRTFGHAITEIQCINGRWFAPAQGGMFSPGPSGALVERMREWDVPGVGQSSWGPAVYGFANGDEDAAALVERVRGYVGTEAAIYAGGFANTGARVWRAPATDLG